MGHDDELIGRAFTVAFRAHAGQTDKSGAPYIGHVVRVAAGVVTVEEVVVALLHDVVEDTDVTLAALEQHFPVHILQAVGAITRRPSEAPAEYYARVAANPLARAVKAADIADNSSPARMSLLDDATRGRLSEKYAKARAALGLEKDTP
ncbi:HD domain-containing protein [Rhodobacterales bacterium HKCCSP123]|nr:HD domain-containing protein [Rhodobacterales bacterium HKCCSP123]